jgi:hypothetical protein
MGCEGVAYKFILCPGCGLKIGSSNAIKCDAFPCRGPSVKCEEHCRDGMEALYDDGLHEIVRFEFCESCLQTFGIALCFPENWKPTPSWMELDA